MGPSRTTKRHQRRRRRHSSTPPSPSLSKVDPTENSTSSSIPSDDNPNYAPSVYPDDLGYSPAYASSNSPYATSDYIPVAPLPVFSGELNECPFAHLLRFDCVCRVNNAASPAVAAHIFPASLYSYAVLWYDIFIDPSLPWEDIRSAFLSAFQPPGFSNRSRTELACLRQSDNETVTRYHVRLLWILKKWPEHGMSEDILKGIFVDGLREELKERVAPQRPATLDEAVMLAASWEQAVDIREAQRKALKTVKLCGFCGVEGHEIYSCEVRQRMEALLASKASDGLEKRDGEGQVENAKALVALKRSDSTRSCQCQCQRHQCWKKAEVEL